MKYSINSALLAAAAISLISFPLIAEESPRALHSVTSIYAENSNPTMFTTDEEQPGCGAFKLVSDAERKLEMVQISLVTNAKLSISTDENCVVTILILEMPKS